MSSSPLPLLLLLSQPLLALSYSFKFASTPQQCKDISFTIDGDNGKPPYRVLIVPFGPTPLPNSIEVRKIMDKNFTDSSFSFQLPFPAQSSFVVVMSDANGFASGGTSGAATVQSSDDGSCFDPSKSSQGDFFFNIDPPDVITQCQSTRLWWTDGQPQGNMQFQGIIPGGQSFTIPLGKTSTVSEKGVGFDWTPNVRGGNTLILVGGDNRGWGSAGSISRTVGDGINPNTNCLDDSSPSSTAGDPAGGSYPTGSQAPSNSSNSSTNVGAIAGGVVGGIVGLVCILLVVFFLWRRKRVHKNPEKRQVDLLQEDEGDETAGRPDELPQYYRPEPFIAPGPTEASSSHGGGRPLSSNSDGSDYPDHSTIAGTSTTRKSGMRSLRPVNIVQHEDAGPPPKESDENETETVELPPAYTHLKQQQASDPPAA